MSWMKGIERFGKGSILKKIKPILIHHWFGMAFSNFSGLLVCCLVAGMAVSLPNIRTGWSDIKTINTDGLFYSETSCRGIPRWSPSLDPEGSKTVAGVDLK